MQGSKKTITQCGKKVESSNIVLTKKGWLASTPNNISLQFSKNGRFTQYTKNNYSIRIQQISPNKTLLKTKTDTLSLLLKKGLIENIVAKKQSPISLSYQNQLLVRTSKNKQIVSKYQYSKGYLTLAEAGKKSTRLAYRGPLVSKITTNQCMEDIDYKLYSLGKILINTKKKCQRAKLLEDSFIVSYDKQKKQLKAFMQKGNNRKTSFAKNQKIKAIESPNGILLFAFDRWDRVTKVRKEVGVKPYTAHIIYEKNGNSVQRAPASFNKRIKRIQYHYRNGKKESPVFSYDSSGRLASIRSAKSQPTQFLYNKKGQLIGLKESSKKISLSYSGKGALRSVASLSASKNPSSFSTRSGQLNTSAKTTMELFTKAYKKLGPLYWDTTLLAEVIP